MGLETATYIADLIANNPTGTDPKSQGDDHLRLLKTVLQATFAGFAGPVLVVGTEAQGATANDFVMTVSPEPAAYVDHMIVIGKATHTNSGAATFKVNALAAVALAGVDGAALSAGDIETGAWFAVVYDSATPAMVLLSGNDRGARDGDTWTGTHDFSGATILAGSVAATSLAVGGIATGTTPTPGDNTTRLATTQFVVEAILGVSTTIPGQADKGGLAIATDGTTANWGVGPAALPLMLAGVI